MVGVQAAHSTSVPAAPSFARATGFVSTNAIPMRLRGRVVGVLGLFQTDPAPLSPEDITLAHSELERGQPQYALTSRVVLEQGKGILAERRHIPLDDAFAALRTCARSNNHRLAQLARRIVGGSFDTDLIPHPAKPSTH